ncbi:uncharacterized protein LOC133926794 [Phragmites australis]|uniref:uncharacterized protein LOC133926794 n=1 Tax=Phragmites australis TaxID=29695 RepID=UPI002D78FC36|nr:uncharacterized protein LOC133926794 [Phragmites australis]
MAASTSSPFLASPRFSCQIAGNPTPAPRYAPAVRILSWKRFAASSCEVSLVLARLPRPPPRRRNALREKTSPLPPLVVRHQVRPPYDVFPELGSLDSQEPTSGSLGAEPSSDLDEKLEISGGLDAFRSGNFASKSELDNEKDVIGVAEEITFCGTGAGPVFSVYEDPEGNVMHVEVDEDEIINKSEAADGERSCYSDATMSCARVMGKELKSGRHMAPKNSSLFQFVATERMESPAVNGEVSVAQRMATPLGGFAWSGFAALCSVCLVFAASKLVWRNSKSKFPRRLFYMHRHGMKRDGLDKAHGYPGALLRRPHLDRKELMNNIKRAKESREWFVLSNAFSCKTVANGDANITEIRRTVTEVHTPVEGSLEQGSTEEKKDIVFSHPIVAIDKEVSASYGGQSDPDEVSGSSNLTGISLSNDRIEESVAATLPQRSREDMKNGEPVMNTSEKNQDNIGEIELPEPTYNKKMTGASDRTSMIYASEKEAQTGSAKDHDLGPNSITTTSSEFESKEQFAEICTENLDCIQGTKPSLPFISDKHMTCAKDNAHQFSTNVVSERADGLSSDCFNMSPSELRNNKTPLDISVSDLNGIKETEAPRTSANVAHTAHCEEFTHNISIIGKQGCKAPVMADTVTATSPQRSREEPVDLRRDSMQSMKEPEPCISTGNDKQLSHASGNEHKDRTVHNKTQIRLEADTTRILDNASTPSLYALQEETIQHRPAKVSRSEKRQEKRTSSSKKHRAHLSENKGKMKKQVCSDKEAETKQSEQGVPGTEIVIDPSNCVPKTKRVPKKRIKKVQNDMERVAAQDDVQSCSIIDQNNNSQRVKKTRRKNLRNASCNQGAQTREENPETTYIVNYPDNAPTI